MASMQEGGGILPVVRALDEGEALHVLGITLRIKVSAAESAGSVTVFVTENPPRIGPPLHIHRKEDETFFVIDGEYRVCVGDTTMTLTKGQSAFLPRGIPHTYANIGAETGRILTITTPGGFDGFFREVDALCHAGPPSPEALAAAGARYGLEIAGPPIFA